MNEALSTSQSTVKSSPGAPVTDRTLNGFAWFELITTDLHAAAKFYHDVVGWRTEHAGMPGTDYMILSAGDIPLGGMMTIPSQACEAGISPRWMGYIKVGDVDAAADMVVKLGGNVHRPPDDLPGIGRFAVIADPQGAALTLFAWTSDEPPASRPETPGQSGWRELRTTDPSAACRFYAALLGWEKGEAVDMGRDGKYQLVGLNGTMFAGVSPVLGIAAPPHWFHYFNVESVDAACGKVEAGGGKVLLEPHEVPGGAWIIHAEDPQGTAFGVAGPRN